MSKRVLAILVSVILLLMSTASLAEGAATDDDVVDFGDFMMDEGDTAVTPPADGGDDTIIERDIDDVLYNGEFVIGATTRLNGMFFTNMWGNNTSDIDVRSLIHGYSPVVWTWQTRFDIDPQVVASITTGFYDNGNKFYGIELMPDLTYNDGTPITAQDYLFSLMLFASPVVRELGAITTNSSYLAGYEEYYNGETDIFSGLHLLDDHAFTIEIKAEYLPFFFELGYLDCIPYPMSLIAPDCEIADDGEGTYIRNIDDTVEELQFNAENLTETILDPDTGYLSHPYVSSGPYMLTDFDWETREARFEINPYYKGYYDGAIPSVDNLVLKSVLPETMMEEYQNGEVQLLNKVVAADNILEGIGLVGEDIARQRSYPRMGLGFINYATEQGPMQFEAVRQAFAYAVDVETFRNEYTASFGYEVFGYYGIGQWMVNGAMGTYRPELIEEEEEQAWDAFSADFAELNRYDQDLETAEKLLIDDGWTLNERGETYVKGTDTTRYKMVDGQLMGLNLQFGKMEDSQAAEMLDEMMREPLASIGITYETTVVPFVDLLQHYYRQVDRTYDIMYLATNFISIFDPYFVFNTDDAYQGTQNTTGYRDEQLEALALDLRQTEPGDLLTYVQKWMKFQQYWNEKLPMLPLYTNVYFDFFVPELINYNPDAEMNWPVAILYAYLGSENVPQWLIDQRAEAAEAAEAEGGSDDDVVMFTMD